MVRSMYSGVAGMKANQTRMDVIGNNIANANTYGFKSSRTTFRDMYYQQIRGASGGTSTRGGINPSMVGYGAQASSIDLLMTQSSMTTTGNPLDVAITGEGFFQVMDADGNIYYTKAGMFDIDPATGAVIDSNGNFVLGTSATNGKLDSTTPGSSKIIIQVDSIQASVASTTTEISGKTLTITSTNQNKAANIGFTFSRSTEMPDGKRVEAIVDSTSSIVNIKLNATATFTSVSDLQGAVNEAITDAYGGPHPGGDYIFSVTPDPFVDETGAAVSLTGEQIVDTAGADYEGGGMDTTTAAGDLNNGEFANGFRFVSTGLRFSGAAASTITVTKQVAAAAQGTTPAKEEGYALTMTTTDTEGDQVTYTGFIPQERADTSSGSYTVQLSNEAGDSNDTIVFSYPNSNKIDALLRIDPQNPPTADVASNALAIGTATPSVPTKNLGWGKGTFSLTGGTEFMTQDIGNLTGISIGADGTIMGTSEAGLQILGRIDLATFANAKGLMQSGNSYFTSTTNSGNPKITIAGENGTGALKNSALEMSNVDLSQEFSDMIVTQRGFQAASRLITVSDTMLEELINLKR